MALGSELTVELMTKSHTASLKNIARAKEKLVLLDPIFCQWLR